jgi:hypothetical protein
MRKDTLEDFFRKQGHGRKVVNGKDEKESPAEQENDRRKAEAQT